MNCINHPETPVSAYCQNCGRPLCTQCVRPVQGVIFCETCLAARLSGASRYNVNVGAAGSNFQYSASGPLQGGPPDQGPNPGLAAFLGFIPGVGAMYNGQFIKALVHVLVFVVLVSITERHGPFGMFVAAWIFYQVFDAYQTAKARRDGLPLPDPFGLNELGNRMSNHPRAMPPSFMPGGSVPGGASAPGASGFAEPGSYSGGGGFSPGTGQEFTPGVASGVASGFSSTTGAAPGTDPGQGPGYATQQGAASYAEYPYIPVSPDPMPPPPVPRRSEPVGAIILIALGLLFLFSTTGFLSGEWIGRAWPLVLIGIGAWLVIKRVGEVRK